MVYGLEPLLYDTAHSRLLKETVGVVRATSRDSMMRCRLSESGCDGGFYPFAKTS